MLNAAIVSPTIRLALSWSWSCLIQISAGGRKAGTAEWPECSFWMVTSIPFRTNASRTNAVSVTSFELNTLRIALTSARFSL